MEEIDVQSYLKKGFVFSVVLLAVFASFVFSPIFVWALFVAAIISVLLIGRPAVLVVFYWVYNAAIMTMLQRYTPSGSFVGMAGEFLLLLASVCYAFSYAIRRGSVEYKDVGIFSRWVVALYGLLGLSVIIHGFEPMNMFLSLTSYYLFPMVFFAALNFINPNVHILRKTLRIAMGLLFLCAVLNFAGFLGLLPWAQNRILVDRAMGTFDSQGVMGFYSIGMMFLCLSMVIHSGDKKTKYSWIIGLGIAGVTFFLTFSFHMYVYVFALYILLITLFKEQRKVKLEILVFSFIVFMIAIFIAPSILRVKREAFNADVLGMVDRSTLEVRLRRFSNTPKISLYEWLVVKNMREEPVEWLFGNGPGQGTGKIGEKFLTPAALKYLGAYFFSPRYRREMAGLSTLSSPRVGILAVWSDIGFVGVIIYFGVYFSAIIHLLINVRRRKYKNEVQLAMAETCILLLGLLVMANLLMSDLFHRHELVGGVWILVALVWVPLDKLDDHSTLDESSTKYSVRS